MSDLLHQVTGADDDHLGILELVVILRVHGMVGVLILIVGRGEMLGYYKLKLPGAALPERVDAGDPAAGGIRAGWDGEEVRDAVGRVGSGPDELDAIGGILDVVVDAHGDGGVFGNTGRAARSWCIFGDGAASTGTGSA